MVAASPGSLMELGTVLLVLDAPIDPTQMSTPSLYGIRPEHHIASASVNQAHSNLVTLTLAEGEELVPGVEYTVWISGGRDATGKEFDPYWTTASFTARSVESETEKILSCVLPDGAIALNNSWDAGWQEGEQVRVVPYFACFSVLGLLRTWQMTGDPRTLRASADYLRWHSAHIGPDNYITDYRGLYPDYPSTGSYDSTDSYAAMFIMAVWHYHLATWDDDFLQEMLPAVRKSVLAMDSTLHDDSLTTATPVWPMKYTMDNVEVFKGYYFASQVALAVGDMDLHSETVDKAHAVRSAVFTDLWGGELDPPRYRVGKNNAGDPFGGWTKYYPDGMANEFVLLYLRQSGDSESLLAWESARQGFLPGMVPKEGIEFFTPAVALRMKDELAYMASYPAAWKKHDETRWSFGAGHHLRIAYKQQDTSVLNQSSLPKITIDGNLEQEEWHGATRFYLGPVGDTLGYDNVVTHTVESPDALPTSATVAMTQRGGQIYGALQVFDLHFPDSGHGETYTLRLGPDTVRFVASRHGSGLRVTTDAPDSAFQPLMAGDALLGFKAEWRTSAPINMTPGEPVSFSLRMSDRTVNGKSESYLVSRSLLLDSPTED